MNTIETNVRLRWFIFCAKRKKELEAQSDGSVEGFNCKEEVTPPLLSWSEEKRMDEATRLLSFYLGKECESGEEKWSGGATQSTAAGEGFCSGFLWNQ